MNFAMNVKSRKGLTWLLALSLWIASMSSYADNYHYQERPSAGAMIADVVVARPLLLVGTVIGTGAFLVSLPFSLLGGNAGDAAEALVLEPASATFLRCLGCKPGERNHLQEK